MTSGRSRKRATASFLEDFLRKLNGDRLTSPTLFEMVESAGLTASCVNYLVYKGNFAHKIRVPAMMALLPGVKLHEEILRPFDAVPRRFRHAARRPPQGEGPRRSDASVWHGRRIGRGHAAAARRRQRARRFRARVLRRQRFSQPRSWTACRAPGSRPCRRRARDRCSMRPAASSDSRATPASS